MPYSNGHINLAYSQSLKGPWTEKVILPYNASGNIKDWNCENNNPTATILSNGTVVLVYRADACSTSTGGGAVKAGGNVNQALTTDGGSPLFVASQKGNVDLVKVLLEADGNVNQVRTKDGASPLWMASKNGNVDTVKVLIKAGCDVNQARTNGCSPLLISSQNGHVATVKALLAAGVNVNQALPTNGVSPLFIASQKNHKNIVLQLLSIPNININQSMNNGASPLIIGTYLGNYEWRNIIGC